MFKVNPYRPGAGLMPVYIAGRDEDIQNVSQMFDALTMDIPCLLYTSPSPRDTR